MLNTAKPLLRQTRRVARVSQLDAIFEPEVNVVILERALPAELKLDVHRARALLADRPLLCALDTNARERFELEASLPTAHRLVGDVHRWVELFADLTDASLIGLRLVHLTQAMCPRFHVDRMSLRMVITYCGLGTELVDEAHFDRSWLTRRGSGNELPEPREIERAHTGDVVLLKGEGWPNNAGHGAIHRSPPASGGAPRLVLTLDAL